MALDHRSRNCTAFGLLVTHRRQRRVTSTRTWRGIGAEFFHWTSLSISSTPGSVSWAVSLVVSAELCATTSRTSCGTDQGASLSRPSAVMARFSDTHTVGEVTGSGYRATVGAWVYGAGSRNW